MLIDEMGIIYHFIGFNKAILPKFTAINFVL
jgi:hypothetical protein